MNRFTLALASLLVACAAPQPNKPHSITGRNMAAPLPGPNAPANPVPLATRNVDESLAGGDSLKFVIFWKEAADSDKLGKVDSTFYKLTATAPVVFYPAKALAANTGLRRSFAAGVFIDSLKLAKPAPGDSVVFGITNFTQCRKGDCSVPGSAGWKYKSSFAPPATMPGIRSVEVF